MKLQIKNINNAKLNAAIQTKIALIKRTGVKRQNKMDDHIGCQAEGRGYCTYDVNSEQIAPLLTVIGNENSIILDNGQRISMKQYKASVSA